MGANDFTISNNFTLTQINPNISSVKDKIKLDTIRNPTCSADFLKELSFCSHISRQKHKFKFSIEIRQQNNIFVKKSVTIIMIKQATTFLRRRISLLL